jgi:hypothetical protein
MHESLECAVLQSARISRQHLLGVLVPWWLSCSFRAENYNRPGDEAATPRP